MIGKFHLPISAGGALPDPATYCPANGYILNPINPADGWNIICEFQTNSPSTTTFDPVITASSGEYAWDLGDGTFLIGDKSISHTYLTTATRTVKLYGKGTCNISTIDFSTDNIVGSLNLSNDSFKTCTSYTFSSNPLLTSSTFPPFPTASLQRLYGNNCDITGNFDLSNFTNFNSADIRLYSNAKLTSVTNPTSYTGTIQNYYFYACDLTGTLNISTLNKLGTAFDLQAQNNIHLTSFISPSSYTGNWRTVNLNSCNITGTLDLSTMTVLMASGFGSSIDVGYNSLLTGITPPSTVTGIMGQIYIQNCNIIGTLNVSMYSSWSTSSACYFDVTGNSNMTAINWWSGTSGLWSQIRVGGGVTGTVDLSRFVTLSSQSDIVITGSGITGITWPSAFTFSGGAPSSISITGTSIPGNLDLSKFTTYSTFGTNLMINSNPYMTGIIWATTITAGTIALYQITNNAILSSLDLSKITAHTATARYIITTNPLLTSITLPATVTGTISELTLHSNGITLLDLSKYTTYTATATIDLHSNTALTTVTFPPSTITGFIKTLSLYGCTALGYVDITKLRTGVASLAWRFDGCGWTAAIVNHVTVDCDVMSASGFTGRVINIGGTNTDPDSSSGGYDGIAARNSLIAKGFTVTIT